MRFLVLSTLSLFAATMFVDDANACGKRRNRGCGGCGGAVVVSSGCSSCGGHAGGYAMSGCNSCGGYAYGTVGGGYAMTMPMPSSTVGTASTTPPSGGVIQASNNVPATGTTSNVVPANGTMVVPSTNYYSGPISTYPGTVYYTDGNYYSNSPGYYSGTGGRGMFGRRWR